MRKIVIALLFLILFKVEGLHAQWQITSGPAMLAPKSVAKIDSVLFLGTTSGVYKSLNGGTTWIATNSGTNITSVRVLFATNSVLYAGTHDGLFFPVGNDGIFRSSDMGNTWTKCKSGKISQIFTFDNKLIVRADDGCFSSQDSGQTWQTEPFPNGYYADFYAAKSNELFGCFHDGGVYSRNIADTSWTRRSNNVITDSSFESIVVKDSILCVATTGDFYISTDMGATWIHPLNTGMLNSPVTALLIDSNFIYAATNNGLLRTSDLGVSWSTINGANNIYCLKKLDNKIYLGNENGLDVTQDNGATWTNLYFVYSNSSQVTSLASKDSTVLAGFGSSVYSTKDEGTKWVKIPPSISNINCLKIIDSTIYAGTAGGGVYKRNLADTSWYSSNNGISGFNIKGFTQSGNFLYTVSSSGVFQSTNQGQNWTNISSNLGSRDVYAILTIGNRIFVGTSIGIYLSQNNGASWSKSDIGIHDSSKVLSLAIKDSTIYAGTFGYGIFSSVNFGTSWTSSNSGIVSSNPVIKFISVIGTNLFIGVSGASSPNTSYLHISTNSGASWSKYSYAPDGSLFVVNALALDNSYLFAASNKGMVWKRPISQLPNTCATTLSVKTYVCDNDSVLLTANINSGYTYQWLKQGVPIVGANTPLLYAKESGIYACNFGGGCVGTSPPLLIYGKPSPQPLISTQQYNICPQNDSAFVSIDSILPFNTYQWYKPSGIITGATHYFYYAKSAGNYYCVVADSFLCRGTSNLLLIGTNPYADTVISVIGSTKICQGDSVRLDAYSGVLSNHQWLFNGIAIPGALSSSYFAKQKGVYNCILTNDCNTLSMPITISYTPFSYFIPHADTLIPNIWHLENLSSGNSNLTYQWDWGDFTSSTGDSPSHLYTAASKYNVCVTALDSAGCSNSYCDSLYASAIYVIPPLNTGSFISTQKLNKIDFFPIPFSKELTINLNHNNFNRINIYNILGDLVYQNQIENEISIKSEALAKGVYIVELTDGKNSIHRKVYKY